MERAHAGPVVVATHHLPSLRSVAERYRNDPVTAGFASRLDPIIARGPAVWAHGHTHDSCLWRARGGTLVVCNPAGYALRNGRRENAAFAPRLVVDIAQRADGSWRAVRSPE
jgi:Icc-related predicted phosphoesterase